MSLKVENLDGCINFLKLKETEINEKTQKIVMNGVKNIKEEVQKVIMEYASFSLSRGVYKGNRKPLFDTGKLHKNWNFEVQSSSNKVLGEVTTNTHYAAYLEFGTSRIVAFNFLQIAVERVLPQIYEELKNI